MYDRRPTLIFTGDLDKAHEDDAAYDLCADSEYFIAPGERVLIGTGVRVHIPKGHAGLVLPRSGNALKRGLTVLNTPGLIDPGYRGEVGVILANFDFDPNKDEHGLIYDLGYAQKISRGDRIAQLLIVPTTSFAAYAKLSTEAWQRHIDAEQTARGESGFGSTGR